MLRQTRLHHGLRNELKDSAGWTCLDSKEAVGSRTAAPELQQVLPAPQAALAASAGIACWEAHVPQGHSDSRGDSEGCPQGPNSLAVPSGVVGFVRSRIALVPLPSTEAQRSLSEGRQVSGSGSLPWYHR